jgi:hypothetical protein
LPYCPKCGSEVALDAQFCPKCGASLAVTAAPSVPQRVTVERREKGEKHEKREKGEKQEKSGDRTGPIVGGLILIWLGVSFYLSRLNYFSQQWWTYFVIGVGVILIIQAAIRYATLPYKGAAAWTLVGGVILVIVGFASVYGVQDWWWLIFVLIGLLVIVSGINASRRSPRP